MIIMLIATQFSFTSSSGELGVDLWFIDSLLLGTFIEWSLNISDSCMRGDFSAGLLGRFRLLVILALWTLKGGFWIVDAL